MYVSVILGFTYPAIKAYHTLSRVHMYNIQDPIYMYMNFEPGADQAMKCDNYVTHIIVPHVPIN